MKNEYKSFGIYRITNTENGKSYIGKTSTNFGDRWDCHRAKLRGGYHDNPNLQSDWDIYGENAFEFSIIEKLDSCEKLNDLEIFYIGKYKKIGASYNIADGGNTCHLKGKHLSDETKKKIGEKNRQNMLGRKIPEDVKRKMSEAQKKRYEKWNEADRIEWGRKVIESRNEPIKWSEESKKNFSKKQSIKPNGAKYDVDLIRKIRFMYNELKMKTSDIAKELSIPQGTIYGIVTYRRWKNV